MSPKDVLAQFRNAAWRSAEEIEQFAFQASDLAAADMLKLLELLQARVPPAEASLHKLRCQAFAKLTEKAVDRTLFGPYVRALRAADPALRAALAGAIPRVNNVSEHAALVALLRAPEPPLRQTVARILTEVGGKAVFDMLSAMAGEAGFPGRIEALDALVAIAPQHSIPALAGAFAAGNQAEKIKAVGHLTEARCMGRDPAAALKVVATALADPDESVAAAAVSGLAALGAEQEYLTYALPLLESRSVNLVKAVIDGLRFFPGPGSVAALQRKLRAGPNTVRVAAIEALEAIGTPDVLGLMVEALGHTQVAVRTRAAEALRHLSEAGKVDIARTVVFLLRSRDVNVRRMAVELVQSVKDPEGELWPKLLGFLRDEDWWVRERVMDALAEMAGEQLVRHLGAFLQDPSDLVRRSGVDALLRLKSPAALGALVRTAAADPDWWVRERALEAIGAIGDQRAVPHVLEIMQRNPQLQVAGLQALAAMGAKQAAPKVALLLSSLDEDVQIAALQCLKVLNDREQAPAVHNVMRHQNTEVRYLARELVTRWGAADEDAVLGGEPVPMLDQLLIGLARMEGDDLLLSPGRRPMMKRLGKTTPLAATVLGPDKVKALLVPHLSARQLDELEDGTEVDFSYHVEREDLRFRVNVFQQFGGVSAVFRIIRGSLPELEKLGLPAVATSLADHSSGLVLVGGPTGSGKSTTLAALIDYINRTSQRHIVSLEDPIEVVHPRKSSLVNQREVGTHTGSFSRALRATLRQDPDVILVGELRDLATVSFAVTAAETGHLVFGTIHTVSAAGTIDRLVNAFPPNQQDHVRAMLAGSLRAVLCQHLLARADGQGRILAVEIMLNNEAIANLIRKGKTFQIPSVIATARDQGMQLMDADLMRLARERRIGAEEAYAKALVKKDFEALLGAEGSA